MTRVFLLATVLASVAALQAPPLATRRSAVMAGAIVPSILLAPRAAHADEASEQASADAIAAIAAKNQAATQEARKRKEAEAELKGLKDAASGGFNLVVTGAFVVLLGGIGAFALNLKGAGDKITVSNLEDRRFMTAQERKDAGLD